ncbi:aspartate aminotransferase [Candidatus Roizmanbacteria bacterium RIFCSPHIGHO2_01_FULL_39_12c]|uniref:Aminotransferase n=1 Tax=Candidatus Roizmanbacteria bacterium RIFCSPHIGHO2_01_FULL_39_12c TaxID=1802031 RepID=A0A1F7G869_9BACT|nr:MAG: aspartate aminotransferase [Candidatus Roizmanbacteria bacterium RIFCSPHIGHO2_01_FULL_39_12c]OGK46617.1 MAG: aspartate aminotransferase [Candidatus Roizmanbacteria bacterium RIFCSPLOWO2_01_FULL_40_13]
MQLSKRFLQIPESPIRKLVPLAASAINKGVKVLYFNIGDPDIETPGVMLKVLHKWRKNPIAYSRSHGEPELLAALKKYYHRLGFPFIEEGHLLVTLGGSEAISMATLAVTEYGDEILTFEPFYTNYNSYAAVNGIKIIPVKTQARNGFHLPPANVIEKKISKKTKAILYCNPNNPTGTVYSQKEVEILVSLAKKHGLFLISDEVYREFVFDGKKHVSILQFFQEIPDQAILVDSLSKRYSLCGARIGLISSLNKNLMSGVMCIAQGRLSAGLIDQTMAAQLTQVPKSYFLKVHQEYQKRRDVLYRGLKSIPGVTVRRPEGAFYCVAGLPVKDSEDFCRFLLTDFNHHGETIMIAPAAGFYASPGLGMNEVRIAYVVNTSSIKKLIVILRAALLEYKKSRSRVVNRA